MRDERAIPAVEKPAETSSPQNLQCTDIVVGCLDSRYCFCSRMLFAVVGLVVDTDVALMTIAAMLLIPLGTVAIDVVTDVENVLLVILILIVSCRS